MSLTHGGTRTHWMIGTPISQVQMPGLANAFFDASERDEVLVPLEVQPQHLQALLGLYATASNVGGLISTLPHKAALSRLVDRCSERAALIGMVNVVRKDSGLLVGDMLDGEALVRALESRGFPIGGASALVIGCGGFGSAAAFELLQAGARHVDLIDVDRSRSAALAARLQEHFGRSCARSLHAGQPLAAELLVQACPQGMHEQDEPPVDVQQVRGLLGVVDAIAGHETRLMQASRAAGLMVVGGQEIARAQLQPVLSFWASTGLEQGFDAVQRRRSPQAERETNG